MSAPSNGTNQPNRPNQGSKKSKKAKANIKSTPFTFKLRSADPLSNDAGTARIQARLASGGTAVDIAEEGYRLCRINTSLRRDLYAAKAEIAAPLASNDDAARIKNRLDNGATAKEIAEEAYRVCRVNAHVKEDNSRVQAELRKAKKKIAVKDDALGEMRKEYPEMRKLLERTWGLLKGRRVDVPEDLSRAYKAILAPEGNWQGGKKKAVVKRNKLHEPKARKAEVKVEKKNEEPTKMPFLLHMPNGKTYDLEKLLVDQDSDGEDSEPEPPVLSKKRKRDDMEISVAKKARVEDELEEGEIEE